MDEGDEPRPLRPRLRPDDRIYRWTAAALVAAVGGLVLSAASPVSDGDAIDYEQHLAIAAVILVASFVLFLIAPAGTRLRGLAKGFAVGIVVGMAFYLCPPEIAGRGDFQFRSLLALVATGAILWIVKAPRDSLRAQAFGGVLGIVTPPLLLFALLVVSCPDGGCFD